MSNGALENASSSFDGILHEETLSCCGYSRMMSLLLINGLYGYYVWEVYPFHSPYGRSCIGLHLMGDGNSLNEMVLWVMVSG
jgi:hypothetical protein